MKCAALRITKQRTSTFARFASVGQLFLFILSLAERVVILLVRISSTCVQINLFFFFTSEMQFYQLKMLSTMEG